MALLEIRKPHKNPPLSLLYYGARGMGKTTLAMKTSVGKTLILAFENVDIIAGRHGGDVDIIDGPTTRSGIIALFNQLASTPHGYDTIIVDSVTSIDAIFQKDFVDVQSGKAKFDAIKSVHGLGAFGAGKGEIEGSHSRVAMALADLRANGARVIVIGHERAWKVKPPAEQEFDKFGVAGFSAEAMEHYITHADAVGRLYSRESHNVDKKTGVTKVSTGNRVIDFVPTAQQEAKARIDGIGQVFDWLDPNVVPFAQHLAKYESEPAEPFSTPSEFELVSRAKAALADGRWAAVESNLVKRGYATGAISDLKARLESELKEEFDNGGTVNV